LNEDFARPLLRGLGFLFAHCWHWCVAPWDIEVIHKFLCPHFERSHAHDFPASKDDSRIGVAPQVLGNHESLCRRGRGSGQVLWPLARSNLDRGNPPLSASRDRRPQTGLQQRQPEASRHPLFLQAGAGPARVVTASSRQAIRPLARTAQPRRDLPAVGGGRQSEASRVDDDRLRRRIAGRRTGPADAPQPPLSQMPVA